MIGSGGEQETLTAYDTSYLVSYQPTSPIVYELTFRLTQERIK